MKIPQTPEKSMLALMASEIEREATRLAFRFTDLRDRIRIVPTEAGVVTFGRIGGMEQHEASFPRVMRILAALPDRDGSEGALRALDKAHADGKLRPRPQNVGTHLQVGDAIGESIVENLAQGTTYANAKNGRDVKSIPREYVVASPDAIIVGLMEKGGAHGHWRRASQIAGNGLKPTRGSRNALPQLRGLHADLKRCAAEARHSLDKPGQAERFLAYHRMISCVRTMLVKASGPYSRPEASERIFLDVRRRDSLPLLRQGLPDTFAGGKVHAEIRDELAAIDARKIELGREMAAERPRDASPAP